MSLASLFPGIAHAGPTNGIVTLMQETLAPTGGESGTGSPPKCVMGVAGEPVTGELKCSTKTVRSGYRSKTTNAPNPSTMPPPRPTVLNPPAFTSATSVTLNGTKTAGTSIWINGVQKVTTNSATTWSASVTLTEGDNVLAVTAKDATGKISAGNTVTIVLDKLPPVITVTTPLKSNLNPTTIGGTVDDSLTRVEVNAQVALRVGKQFEAVIPFAASPMTVTIKATSPNNYVATKTITMTLGRIPTVSAMTPIQGSKLYTGSAVTVQTTASDLDGDPLTYQVLLDGQVLLDWSSQASRSWTPTTAQAGAHALEVRARDGFGGYGSKQAAIYVLRKPILPQ